MVGYFKNYFARRAAPHPAKGHGDASWINSQEALHESSKHSRLTTAERVRVRESGSSRLLQAGGSAAGSGATRPCPGVRRHREDRESTGNHPEDPASTLQGSWSPGDQSNSPGKKAAESASSLFRPLGLNVVQPVRPGSNHNAARTAPRSHSSSCRREVSIGSLQHLRMQTIQTARRPCRGARTTPRARRRSNVELFSLLEACQQIAIQKTHT